LAIPILIGFGIDELSVPPAFVPIVKKIVRSITLAEAKEIAEKIMNMKHHEEVIEYMESIMHERVKEIGRR